MSNTQVSNTQVSNTHTGHSFSEAEPASPDSLTDRHSTPLRAPDAEGSPEFGMGDITGPAGGNLLAPSAAPQGRRSLFRR